MEPQTPTFDHNQELVNLAACFILTGNVYGPDAQVTKGIAYTLATDLKKAGYLGKATRNLLDTASSSMDDELTCPAGIPESEFAECMYDTLYNVAAVHFGYFLEPTDNPEFEAKLQQWAAQSNQELWKFPKH